MNKIFQYFFYTLFCGFLFSSSILLGEVAQSFSATKHHQLLRAVDLNDEELLKIGIKIWQNQCGVWEMPDKMSGVNEIMKQRVTAWEDSGSDDAQNSHALIGIGQFIWYPDSNPKIFQEEWPHVARFLEDHGVDIPKWARRGCPWPNREAFENDLEGPRLTHLREHLVKRKAIIEQTRTIAQRLDKALANIQADLDEEIATATGTDSEGLPTSVATKKKITDRFNQILSMKKPSGLYALMDYVHFCGEGILKTERNEEHPNGWGLRQVLDQMKQETIECQGPLEAFVDAATDLYPYGSGSDDRDYAHHRYETYLSFSL